MVPALVLPDRIADHQHPQPDPDGVAENLAAHEAGLAEIDVLLAVKVHVIRSGPFVNCGNGEKQRQAQQQRNRQVGAHSLGNPSHGYAPGGTAGVMHSCQHIDPGARGQFL